MFLKVKIHLDSFSMHTLTDTYYHFRTRYLFPPFISVLGYIDHDHSCVEFKYKI